MQNMFRFFLAGSVIALTLFRMRRQKGYFQFSPVISTNVGISSQNFLAFSFNLFATLAQNFKAIPSASHKLLNLNLELLNFGHMTTSTV